VCTHTPLHCMLGPRSCCSLPLHCFFAGGSPGSWQITVPDLAHTQLPQSPQQQKLQHYQNQHQQQQQHHSDSPSLEGAPQDGAQEADGEPDGTGGPGSTAGSQHQTLQSDGVSGNHQIVLYTEDERGYGRCG